jgi:hypothetical protein
MLSDTPAVDSGVTASNNFANLHSLYSDVYGLRMHEEFVNILQDKGE